MSYCSRGAPIPMRLVSPQEGCIWTQIHTHVGRRPPEDWIYAATDVDLPEARRKSWDRTPLHLQQERGPVAPGSQPSAFRTVREYVSVVGAPVCGTLLWWH